MLLLRFRFQSLMLQLSDINLLTWNGHA